MKKILTLRDYQEPKVKEVLNELPKTGKIVLAASPGSGKTEMAVYIIKRYLDQSKKVLVLAHATVLLKDNFQRRWNKYYDSHPNLTICIPNGSQKITGNYDLVIVDEGHEWYLAKTVQVIVKNIPQHLILTGTPEKFVNKPGFKLIGKAMADLPRKYFAKTAIELMATQYDWSNVDYNVDGELKKSAKVSKEDTEKAVKSVIHKLIERSIYKGIEPNRYNRRQLAYRINKFFIKNTLEKTMIACKRGDQALWVKEYLEKVMKISCKISDSKQDKKNLVIYGPEEKYKDQNKIEKLGFVNGEFTVLIVVNRGQLGFDDDNLMNFIDMTGSHNPSRIYQMFCRVVRGNQSQQKLFLKVAPKGAGQMDLMSISTEMALSLMFEDVLLNFNGKNMRDQFIIVKKKGGGTTKPNTGSKKSVTKKFYPPSYELDVVAKMIDIRANLGDEDSIYKRCNVGEIINTVKGLLTREECIAIAKTYKTIVEFRKNGLPVYHRMRRYFKEDYYKIFPNGRYKTETREECIAIAKTYKTPNEFIRGDHKGIASRMYREFTEDYYKIFPKKEALTREECIAIAKTYKTRKLFINGSPKVKNRMKTFYSKDLNEIFPHNWKKKK